MRAQSNLNADLEVVTVSLTLTPAEANAIFELCQRVSLIDEGAWYPDIVPELLEALAKGREQ